MTKLMPFLILFALIGIGAMALSGKSKEKPKKAGPIVAKRPLTENEQPMYFRLIESLPDCVILAQVAFSALLDTQVKGDMKARGTFSQKVADFVICSKAFEVLAIVELDDSSHGNKGQADAARDKMLTDAGYRVIRYKKTPDVATVKKDILITPVSQTTGK